MKKHLFQKSLLVLIGVLITSLTSQVWAGTGYTFNKPYFFFYNDAGWSQCMVLYGREWDDWYDSYKPGHYTKSWNLDLVENTEKLYYAYIDDYWNDSYNQIAVLEAASWGDSRDKIGNRWNGGDGKTKHTDYIISNYTINYWNTYFWNGKGASSLTHCAGGAADITTYTTTLNIKVKESGDADYSNGSTSDKPASTIKLTGSYINDDHRTAAVRSDAEWSDGYSCSYNTVVSGKVTPSYSTKSDDWQFDGWYEGSTRKSTSTSYDFYQTAATTVEARFTRIKYTISFDRDGGSGGTSSIKATYGSAMPSITVPSSARSGYTFDGYYSGQGGTGTKYYNADGSSARTSNINNPSGTTLYAKWKQTVALNPENGGSNTSVVMTYLSGSHDAITNPTKTGYTFAGWYAAADGNALVINTSGTLQNSTSYSNASGQWTNSGSAPTLHAHWTAKSYDVTLNPDNGGATTYTISATYDAAMPGKYKNSSTSVSAPSKDNYTFAGYYDGRYGAGTQYYTATPSSARNWDKDETGVILYGKWTQAITLNRNGATTGSTGLTATNGATLDLSSYTAPSIDGYDFGGYQTAGGALLIDENGVIQTVSGITNSSKEWENPSSALTLTAIWTGKPYTLKLMRNDGTDAYVDITVTMGSNECTPDISKPERAGYSFLGYYTDASGGTQVIRNDASKVTSDYFDSSARWKYVGNVTLYAHWEEVALTFDNGDGDNLWSNASNWSPACVPTSAHDVTISTEATVSGSAVAKSVTIASGGKVTITSTGALEVQGSITNTDPGNLVVNSRGALIYSGSTSATVELSLTSNRWQLIAIPVWAVDVSRAFAGKDIYTYVWNNSEYDWERRGYYDGLGGFEPVLIKGSGGYNFSGTLVGSSDKGFSVTYNSGKDNGDVGMYGNSWTAPIAVSEMTFTGVTGSSAHTFNGSTWDGAVSGDVIPAMQGFAVVVGSSGGSVTIPYSAVRAAVNRNAALRAPKHTTSDISDPITIYVSGNEWKNRIRLFENERFSDEMDEGYEAIHMEGEGFAGELYALADMKMNVLATNDLEGTVVGFIPGEATNYTISFEGDGKGYYLNDVKEEESTLIAEGNTYEFTPDESTNAARFIISKTPINHVLTGADEVNDGVKARKQMIDGILYIIRDGRIYDATGVLVK